MRAFSFSAAELLLTPDPATDGRLSTRSTTTAMACACLLLAVVGFLTPSGASADQTFNVSVPGTADIFAAGLRQPPALEPNSGSPGTGGGTIPPSVNFTSVTGDVVTVPSVTGEIFFNGPGLTSVPNGNPGFATDLNPVGPISGIIDADSCEFLVGVFLSSAEPSGAPPASLDFSSSAPSAEYTTLAPELGQTFFIGSGSTSSGQPHQIRAPAGADRLFLGIADGHYCEGNPGTYDDDGGAYQTTIDLSTHGATLASAAETQVIADFETLHNLRGGRSYPKDDKLTGGNCTIGYGRRLTPKACGPDQTAGPYGGSITQAQAAAYLKEDVAGRSTRVLRLVGKPLSQQQLDALVDFEFNSGALAKSTLLKDIQGDASDAQITADFKLYIMAYSKELKRKVDNANLLARRTAEANLYVSGTYPPIIHRRQPLLTCSELADLPSPSASFPTCPT